jgi:hypothetical protein
MVVAVMLCAAVTGQQLWVGHRPSACAGGARRITRKTCHELTQRPQRQTYNYLVTTLLLYPWPLLLTWIKK